LACDIGRDRQVHGRAWPIDQYAECGWFVYAGVYAAQVMRMEFGAEQFPSTALDIKNQLSSFSPPLAKAFCLLTSSFPCANATQPLPRGRHQAQSARFPLPKSTG